MKYLQLILVWLLLAVQVASSQTASFFKPASAGGFDWTGLYAYYKLEEASGTRVDQTTNALNLTDNNSTGNTNGIILKGVNLISASSKYLSRANFATNANTQLTISVWINARVIGGSSKYICSKSNFTTTHTFGPKIFTSGTVGMFFDAGNTITAQSTSTLSINTWYYLTFIYDGTLTGNSNRFKIWINGVQETVVFTGTVPANLGTSATETFYVGSLPTGGTPGLFFDGCIDELGLFSIPITSSQVASLYNSGAGITYQ